METVLKAKILSEKLVPESIRSDPIVRVMDLFDVANALFVKEAQIDLSSFRCAVVFIALLPIFYSGSLYFFELVHSVFVKPIRLFVFLGTTINEEYRRKRTLEGYYRRTNPKEVFDHQILQKLATDVIGVSFDEQ